MNRFANSFHPKVKPPAGEPCALKWHYSGVMRELVGYFESMATLEFDPTGERFVYTSVAYLLRKGKLARYKGTAYSESAIRHALAELRARRIISKPLERERWLSSGEKGHEVLRKLTGSIVALHDCIAHKVGDECHFVGPMKLCGRWQRTGDGGPGSVLYWNGCAQHATGKLPNGKQMLSGPNAVQSAGPIAAQSAEQCAGYCAEPSAEHCAGSIAKPDSGQASDVAEDSRQNGGQAVVTVMPVQTASPAQPEQPTNPAESAPPAKTAAAQESKPGGLTTSQPSGACAPYGHDVTKPLGSEITIGQQFTIEDDMQLLREISDGEFNPNAYKQTGDIDLLCEYTRMVVEEIAGVPWDNQRTTCAVIMDAVAKQINRAGKQYPKGWLKVLKELQKGGTCKAVEPYRPPQNPNWVGYQNHDGPPNERDVKAHSNSDFQLCDDWICRNEPGRADEGFTVRNTVGAWARA
jgi:hypothetical protein